MTEPLDPRIVLGAYAVGVFPMADSRDAEGVYWVEPRRRAILPLDGFHLSRSLRQTIAADRFRVTADRAFADVLRLCAESAIDRPDTWISGPIEQVFNRLHQLGFAHSVECWDGGRLAGGLYGLALGRAFFGESMVSRATDASKVALAWLVARLRVGGFTLLDCQFQTPHLQTLGTVEIERADYLALLATALSGIVAASVDAVADGATGDFFALDTGTFTAAFAGPPIDSVAGPVAGKAIAQLLVQTS